MLGGDTSEIGKTVKYPTTNGRVMHDGEMREVRGIGKSHPGLAIGAVKS